MDYRGYMKQKINYVQSSEEQTIVNLIRNVRMEEKLSLAELAMGLMSPSQLAKIERGERPFDKNVRDRILERLGMAKELYENLLDKRSYEEWELRKKILAAVRKKKNVEVLHLITEFENQLKENDKINRQFLFVMQGEIARQEGAPYEVIARYYQRAAELTIPEPETVWQKRRPLSVSEMNMLLEGISCKNGVEYFYKCRKLMEYVETGFYDNITKAKIYPKIAFCYLKKQLVLKLYWKEQDYTENLGLCDKAIEMLRDAGRTYYLVELLEMKIDILKELLKSEQIRRDKMETDFEESNKLLNLMKKLYTEYNVSIYMEDCTYLYQQNWVFRVSEVLKIRREMFGMTQEQLCDGICSVKTLRRAEKGQTDMQMETLQKLMSRLGLSGQMQWSKVITSNPKMIKRAEKIETLLNDLNLTLVREELEILKKHLMCDIPQNRQYILEKEAILGFLEEKIDSEEFVKKEKEALMCTLPVNNLLKRKHVYLTEGEIICIRNSWRGLDNKIKKEYIQLLLDLFEKCDLEGGLADVISSYEFVISGVVNELGNMGEHRRAVEIDKKTIADSLQCRRLWDLDYKLYDIIWNENKLLLSAGKKINKKITNENLMQCIAISHYLKQYFYENMYKSKLISD